MRAHTWNTLYTHIKNAYNEASEVNQKQDRLRLTYKQITEIEEEK